MPEVLVRDDRRCAGILAPAAVRKARRRAEILPRLIVIPHAVVCRGAKYILSCAVRDFQILPWAIGNACGAPLTSYSGLSKYPSGLGCSIS
jgi:hypothetical protein